MKGAIQAVRTLNVRTLSLLAAGLCSGCMTMVDVSVDERAEVSRFQTWSYAVSTVDASRSEAEALHLRLAPLIEAALSSLGFERTPESGDFLVTYRLGLRYRPAIVSLPSAPEFVSSNHASPSYWVEGSKRERRTYRDIFLAIDVVDRTGRSLWQGELHRRHEAYEPLGLSEAVGALLARFPARAGG